MATHFGGYLPVIADVTPYLKYGQDNVISVWADNSNDPSYPPGKQQDILDFSYFGGIYRDCWMVVHNNVYLTDPNYENQTAGGGFFVSFRDVSEKSAGVRLDAHVRNQSLESFSGKIEYQLFDRDNKLVKRITKSLSVARKKARQVSLDFELLKPHLWSPDTPYLYQLHVRIFDKAGHVVDGYRRRVGNKEYRVSWERRILA